jgi:hypothetical protein
MTGAAAAVAAMATVRGEFRVLAARRWKWRLAVRRERRMFIHGDAGTGGVTEVEAGVSGDERQGKARELIGEVLMSSSKAGLERTRQVDSDR